MLNKIIKFVAICYRAEAWMKKCHEFELIASQNVTEPAEKTVKLRELFDSFDSLFAELQSLIKDMDAIDNNHRVD